MKKLFLIISFLIFSNCLQAQDTILVSKPSHLYGGKIKVIDSLISGVSASECNKIHKDLYKIEILEVYFMRDSSVFKNSNELLEIKFLLIDKNLNLKKNQQYYIIFGNTINKFIIDVKEIHNNYFVFKNLKYSVVALGLQDACLKLNFFQKITFMFKNKKGKEKTYNKVRLKKIKKDPFLNYVESHISK